MYYEHHWNLVARENLILGDQILCYKQSVVRRDTDITHSCAWILFVPLITSEINKACSVWARTSRYQTLPPAAEVAALEENSDEIERADTWAPEQILWFLLTPFVEIPEIRFNKHACGIFHFTGVCLEEYTNGH